MREHKINELNNFIGGWYLDDMQFCDDVIQYMDEKDLAGETNPGVSLTSRSDRDVDLTIKNSKDYILNNHFFYYSKYNYLLQNVLDEYIKKYPDCNSHAAFKMRQNTNIQKYPPNGGYLAWHCERTNGSIDYIASRHLVFMTYLNDITDGGETEFKLQNIKVKPEKGLTLIWPADWTFTHRGITSPTETKYILTGWFNYE